MRNGSFNPARSNPPHLDLLDIDWEEQPHEPKRMDLKIDQVLADIDLFPFQPKPASQGKTVYIENLRSEKYRLKDAIPIFLMEENDDITAITYDIGQYGQGPSEEDAIQDLCEVITAYYELLNSEKQLSRQLEAHRRFLSSVIETI